MGKHNEKNGANGELLEGGRMEKAFVTKMESILINQKKEIFELLAKEDAEFKEIIKNKEPKDLGDIAASDIDRNTLEALEVQELKRLNMIDAALARMKNDHYGVCMSCSRKIPRERLEAIPYAVLCVQCKSYEERKSR